MKYLPILLLGCCFWSCKDAPLKQASNEDSAFTMTYKTPKDTLFHGLRYGDKTKRVSFQLNKLTQTKKLYNRDDILRYNFNLVSGTAVSDVFFSFEKERLYEVELRMLFADQIDAFKNPKQLMKELRNYFNALYGNPTYQAGGAFKTKEYKWQEKKREIHLYNTDDLMMMVKYSHI